MRPSALALWVARRAPAIAGLGVRLWAVAQPSGLGRLHWLFLQLKSELKLRLKKRVRLTAGPCLYVDPFDSVGSEIAAHGCYEPDTVALIERLLVAGMVFFDAGAHIGQYTVIASSLVGDGGRVHAFEPDPVTFHHLEANVAVNRCRNVTCSRVALSHEPGRAPLYLSRVSETGCNSLRPTVHYSGDAIEVAVTTADEYARSVSLNRLDLIKADLEGAELPFLQGAAGVIARFRPIIILEFSIHTEPFGYGKDDLQRQLTVWGYALFRVETFPLEPYAPRTADPKHFNLLAVPTEQLEILSSRGMLARGRLAETIGGVRP